MDQPEVFPENLVLSIEEAIEKWAPTPTLDERSLFIENWGA
jgi:hypothetical protein